jgi:Na+-translocating ferredoxin:NAD+ oxidoreductase RnfG subunit
MISGATISSRAVIEVVNEVTGQLQERLAAWRPEEVR